MKALKDGGFTDRTEKNVKDSDGTVIIFYDKPRGGTEETIRFCIEQKQPHKLINAAKLSMEEAAQLIAEFVREQNIETLNIAGPRQTDWAEGYDYAFRALEIVLADSGC